MSKCIYYVLLKANHSKIRSPSLAIKISRISCIPNIGGIFILEQFCFDKVDGAVSSSSVGPWLNKCFQCISFMQPMLELSTSVSISHTILVNFFSFHLGNNYTTSFFSGSVYHIVFEVFLMLVWF